MPSIREKVQKSSLADDKGSKSSTPLTIERCKVFPDPVLFYIFYSMPFDRAQLNASQELRRRKWFYSEQSMRWMKAAPVDSSAQSPKHHAHLPHGKQNTSKKGRNASKNQARHRASLGTGGGSGSGS